jgi:hypothetical protein
VSDEVIEIPQFTKSFRLEVYSTTIGNEYHKMFLEINATGAAGWQPDHHL